MTYEPERRDVDTARDLDVYEEIRRGFNGPRPVRPKITRVTSGHFEAVYQGSAAAPRRRETPLPEPPVEINLSTDPGLGPGNTVLPTRPSSRPPPRLTAQGSRESDTVPTHQKPSALRAWHLAAALVALFVLVLACISALTSAQPE